MNTPPRVSIILPTHNGARTVRAAIESVRQQSLKEWELIVINDGSTDHTGALVTEIAGIDQRIRIVRFDRNQGIQKALNEGLLQARASYIARIDDDDLWSDAKKLSLQVRYLDEHPECVLVGTGVIVQDAAGNELYRFLNPETDAEIRAAMLYRNCFSHSAVMFRKDAALHFNGYDEGERVRHLEDYDLWLKLGTRGSLANLPIYAIRFTSDSSTISGQHKLEQLKRQLSVAAPYCSAYPGAALAHAKAYLRFLAYAAFRRVTPKAVQDWLISLYKRS